MTLTSQLQLRNNSQHVFIARSALREWPHFIVCIIQDAHVTRSHLQNKLAGNDIEEQPRAE